MSLFFLGLVSLLVFGGRSLVSVEMSGCYAVDDNILDDEHLTERDRDLPRIQINVGGEYHFPVIFFNF